MTELIPKPWICACGHRYKYSHSVDECLRRNHSTFCENCADLRQQRDELLEALKQLLKHVETQPVGSMKGLGNQECRFEWYDKLVPIRDVARAAIAKAQ